MKQLHTPVLEREVLDYLKPESGKTYVDCTLGFAGHTLSLLKNGAKVIAIDRDEEIIDLAKTRIKDAGFLDRVTIIHSNFSNLSDLIDTHVDGILFDLGVSSYQLDKDERGFSFMREADLDMRMDKNLSVKASDLINALGKKELEELFKKYGELGNAKSLANMIVDNRKDAPITSTTQLAHLIEKSSHHRGKIHPATQVFQALRIAINDEIGELKAALPSALSLLKDGGVLVVISFHSLEDRIVKNFIRSNYESGAIEILTDKPITATTEEISSNNRSRSAKLRACRKVRDIK